MNKQGFRSPSIRAGYYRFGSAPIAELIRNGWEAGVHGIDNWTDEESAKEEKACFRFPGLTHIGNRVHWLIYDKSSMKILDRAGYYYDSTVGYNDDIGFRAGTLQVFKPEESQNLVELPLHIQDIALFGRSCWELSGEQWVKIASLNLAAKEADDRIAGLMNYAVKYGGVVTVLWHYESIGSPAHLESLYRRLVCQAQADNAWLAPAGPVVEWFHARRALQITCTHEEKSLIISLKGEMKFTRIPSCRLRVYISPDQIQSVDARYNPGTDYIDIQLTRTPVHVLMK